MRREANPWRVGLSVLLALGIVAAAVLVLGQRSQVFARKNHYEIRFTSASGINQGSPVELNGVRVGRVEDVFLSTDPAATDILVTIEVDRRFAERIREDSKARIKTLGLLGDKYLDLSVGSPGATILPPGGTIPTAPMTDVERLLASGEGVMDNVAQISESMKTILKRTEAGEGLLGDLTMDSESGARLTTAAEDALRSVERVATALEKGDGALPRLLHDRELGQRVADSVARIEALLAKAETGDGLLKAAIDDPEARRKLDTTLDNLARVSGDLATLSQDLSAGKGLLGKLMRDERFKDDISRELEQILRRINTLTEKAVEGDGTVARLLDDPAVYEAIEDIIVGVDESRLLRWLLRNRQKKGIEKRHLEVEQEIQQEATEPEPPRP
ncbi:MAG: MlaD family protein [Thermoanaerobaculia bacterium]|nr:MlaD family protein [Thermoanaerobaculia bacterium]